MNDLKFVSKMKSKMTRDQNKEGKKMTSKGVNEKKMQNMLKALQYKQLNKP